MRGEYPGRVEDYTPMCLCMGFVNLLWIMVVIWANYGLLAVCVLALVLNHAITLLGARLQLARMRYAPRPKPARPPQ